MIEELRNSVASEGTARARAERDVEEVNTNLRAAQADVADLNDKLAAAYLKVLPSRLAASAALPCFFVSGLTERTVLSHQTPHKLCK